MGAAGLDARADAPGHRGPEASQISAVAGHRREVEAYFLLELPLAAPLGAPPQPTLYLGSHGLNQAEVARMAGPVDELHVAVA